MTTYPSPTTGDVLDTIDGALHDYATSPDAMRWSPDPRPEPVHGATVRVTRLGPDGAPATDHAVDAPGSMTIDIAPDFSGFAAALNTAVRRLTAVLQVTAENIKALSLFFGTDLAPALKRHAPKRRTPAADRTRSVRWRAGTRRAKQQARQHRARP